MSAMARCTIPARRAYPLALVVALVAPLAHGVPAQAASPAPMDQLRDPAMLVTGVAPTGWKDAGGGLHVRQGTPTDHTLIAIQSSPVGMSTVWSSLLPQLALEAVPDPVGTRTTDALDWTLFQVDVTAVQPPLRVDLALAAKGGRTYIVWLQSGLDEAAGVHDSVFLPVVDALAPLVPTSPSPIVVPYTSEEVTFPGGSPGVTLAGTFTRPVVDRLTAAVVLLSGSGPQDRDESLAPAAPIKPFELIADALTRAGVAVLRFDDRGVGLSTGDYTTATIADLTADGAAAVRYLAGRPDMDPAKIGVLGHSLGGIEVASLGAHDPQVAFVVGMAAPAVDGVSLLVAQSAAVARTSGISEAAITQLEPPSRAMYTAARDGDWPLAESSLRQVFGITWDSLPADTQQQLGDRSSWVDGQTQGSLATLRSVEIRSLLASDPGADWAQVAVPVLGLYGGKDVQVPAEQSAPALRDALDRPGGPDFELDTLPDANHLFQAAVTGSVAEYATLPATFTPDFLPTLVDWVTRQTAPR